MKFSFTIILAFSLVVLLASCGSDEPVKSPGSTESEPDTTTSVKEKEYVKPDVDFGGKTITIPSYKYEGVWNILKYNILLDEENGDFINDAVVERNRKVETDLNIKLELLPLDVNDRNNSSKLQKFILSGEDAFAFALPMNAGLAPMLTTPGMLVDLQSIPTLDLTHSWWNQNANSEYTIYGKQFAAVGDLCFFNIGSPIVNYFSKELVEDNKLDNPYQLVYDGKWTVDKMLQMAASAARDLNGDQTADKDDQFGLASESGMLSYYLVGAGIRLSEHTANGDIKITVNNEKVMNLCEKIITFFHNRETTLYTYYLSGYSNVFSDFILPKFSKNEILFFSNQLHVSLNLRGMNTDFGILPLPKYDDAQKEYVSFANTFFSDHVIVPATNPDLEMTGIILESMGYYSQQLIIPAFIDQTVMNKSVRDEDSAKMVELIRSTQTSDVAFIFDWGKINSNFGTMAGANNTNFASSYASIESNVNAALEKTLADLKS